MKSGEKKPLDGAKLGSGLVVGGWALLSLCGSFTHRGIVGVKSVVNSVVILGMKLGNISVNRGWPFAI